MHALFTSNMIKRKNTIGARILQITIGIYLLFRLIGEFRFTKFIYSTAFEITNAEMKIIYAALLGCFIGAVLLLANIQSRLAVLIVLISFIYLGDHSVVGDGGDNILRITLGYMLLLDQRESSLRYSTPSFRVGLHNIGVFAIIAQICIMYWTGGLTKIRGDTWFNGTALYYIMNVEQYTTGLSFIRNLFLSPVIVTLLTYSTIIYQVGFPFMIFNKFHILWAVIGLFFHLGIMFGMGLVTFSLIMMGLILFTLSDSEWMGIRIFLQDKVIPSLRMLSKSSSVVSLVFKTKPVSGEKSGQSDA